MKTSQRLSSNNREKAIHSPIQLVVVIDKNGDILRVNNDWTTQLGWESEALLGTPFITFVALPHQHSASRILTDVSLEMSAPCTLNFKHKSGADTAYACRAVLMVGSNEHEIYISAELLKTDDERIFERQNDSGVRKRQNEIDSRRLRMHAVAQIARRICHDINNIMTIISGNIQLLGMRDNDQKNKKYISNIEIATERAASVTQNLLRIVRNDQQNQQEMNIDEEIRDILTIIAGAFPPSIVCKHNLQSDQRVMIDKAVFSDSIINIITNAIASINGDGEVSVATRNENKFLEQYGHIIFEPVDAHLYVLVHISDTGKGIAQDDIKQLFTPLAKRAVSTQELGFGLSLLNDFCTLNGLGLQVQSEINIGTSVFLWIPTLSTD